jgi:uncharacterized membrane protein (Fun14 family)
MPWVSIDYLLSIAPQIGFSLLAGVAVGAALRVAMRLALILLGVVFMALFAMQYHGLIHVNWPQVEGHAMSMLDWVYTYSTAVAAYAAAHLPEGAAFVAGAAGGARRG